MISALAQYTPRGGMPLSALTISSVLVLSSPFSRIDIIPQDVEKIYIQYHLLVLPSLRIAIFVKSDSERYCASQLGSQSGNVDAVSQVSNPSTIVTGAIPQYNTLVGRSPPYEDTNLVFLFLESSTDSTALCTSCTRSMHPHAPHYL
ncbi:hypothetical protein PISMIDRAFT_17180 [Pisolithus microcarpus 441]|uniref:Uncharacterized protein n=1 Tax=Pisolithus microcarpus 441 TaxID=765257 RepID=A0A0C9YL81_9AGAM|nr:hypothetical protein BKA83DRAFT_17180 [Pisolithus microcarpus]KIK14574.1 hypothetical protein PISMIDRAFT_17180 [Pisolithus microcarpus 441]